MSIWIRKKQARAAQQKEKRRLRAERPALCALSLPDDVADNSVRVILMGGRRALIENLLGVADVGQECIRLATRDGVMSVQGRFLQLEDVRRGALSVTGQIESLTLPVSLREEAERHD